MSSVTLQQAAIIVDAALKKRRETNCGPLTVAVLGTGETPFGSVCRRPAPIDELVQRRKQQSRHRLRTEVRNGSFASIRARGDFVRLAPKSGPFQRRSAPSGTCQIRNSRLGNLRRAITPRPLS